MRACFRIPTSSRCSTSARTRAIRTSRWSSSKGGTLAEEIKEARQLTTSEIVEIGIQLARALDYAHKRGIVHRDVKPGNIMRVPDSNTIKVADFGICRIDGSEATDATQQTQIGNVLGTPHYMSPEQVIGEKVDSRSDLFSAGVVLYQLLDRATCRSRATR